MNAVLFGCGGEVVLTAGYDQSVRVWDARSNSFDPIQVLSGFKDSVTSLALHEATVCGGSVDGCVRSFDIRLGRVTTDALGAPVTVLGAVTGLPALSPFLAFGQGDRVYSASFTGKVTRCVYTFQGLSKALGSTPYPPVVNQCKTVQPSVAGAAVQVILGFAVGPSNY